MKAAPVLRCPHLSSPVYISFTEFLINKLQKTLKMLLVNIFHFLINEFFHGNFGASTWENTGDLTFYSMFPRLNDTWIKIYVNLNISSKTWTHSFIGISSLTQKQNIFGKINDIHRENCVLLNSLHEWRLDLFRMLYRINWVLYILLQMFEECDLSNR